MRTIIKTVLPFSLVHYGGESLQIAESKTAKQFCYNLLDAVNNFPSVPTSLLENQHKAGFTVWALCNLAY